MNEESGTQTNANPEAQTANPEVTDWRAGISEDLRGAESLANFKDVNDLAKSFLETKKMQGNSIHLLGEGASPEQRAAQMAEVLNKVGTLLPEDEAIGVFNDKLPGALNSDMAQNILNSLKPATAADYTGPEGQTVDEGWKKMAFDAGLTDGQSRKLLDSLGETNQTMNAGAIEARNARLAEVQAVYGAAYENEYRAASRYAKVIADQTGNLTDVDAFTDGSIDPDKIVLYATLAQNAGQEGNEAGKDQTNRDVMTPDMAMKELHELQNNPESLLNKAAPGSREQKAMTWRVIQLNAWMKGNPTPPRPAYLA